MNLVPPHLLLLVALTTSLPPNPLLPLPLPPPNPTTPPNLNFPYNLPYTIPIPNSQSSTLTITLARPATPPQYLPTILADIKHLELDLWSRHHPDDTPNLILKVGNELRGHLRQAMGTAGVTIRVLLEVLRTIREIYGRFGAVHWMDADIEEDGRVVGGLEVRWYQIPRVTSSRGESVR